MKKGLVLTILVGLNIFLFISSNKLSDQVLAATELKDPLGVDLTGQKGPNPAPPIGLTPCGKTMCNENEVCTKYPMEKDEHCVPKDKYPLPQPTPPQDLPLDENGKLLELCPEGEGVYPPNSTCINRFKNTVEDIAEFQKTCIYQPIVEYTSDRFVDRNPAYKNQDYIYCGMGYAGPGNAPSPPGNIPLECAVSMLVYTDVRDAELGSYGPNQETRDDKSSDFIAQNYLFDALFGRPLDLTNSETNPNNNREAYRTYWRLMSSSTQANLSSFILNMANDEQINNIRYNYTDTEGRKKETDLKSIYDALKTQVILFLHFPFIRIGCLTDYPVCPEYAQAIRELKPIDPDIDGYLRRTALTLPLGPIFAFDTAITAYKTALSLFDNDLSSPYSAFIPLEFDSVRSYIVKRKDDFEEEFYKKNPYYEQMLINQLNARRYSTNKPKLTNVSRENTPYVGAIYQGLLSPKFGILSALQPSWLIDTYATPEGVISDYKRGNSSADFPEVKLAKAGWLDFITKQLEALTDDPVGWLYEKVTDLFTDEEETKLDGYTENDKDLSLDTIKNAYVNFKGCPLPVSYHILSPKTAPDKSIIPPEDNGKYDDHHQVVTIMGDALKWSWAPQPFSTEYTYTDIYGNEHTICRRSPDNEKQYPIDDCNAMRRHWNVYGVRDGKALTVLNNPKETDIKNAIVQESKFSLYKTIIPDAFNRDLITDASIDAPYAANYSAYRDGENTATAPNGQSRIINEVEPINRINNRAQDTAHILQNCWVVPGELQNSPRCEIDLIDAASSVSAEFCKDNPVPDSAVNSKYLGAFKENYIDLADRWTTSCPGAENNLAEECYNFVASEAQKGGVNPAFALTIWLNESGASNYCYGGETTQDMGINLPSLYQNLEEQIKVFINMAKQKLCEGEPGFIEPMHGWLSRFQSSDGICDINDNIATQYYFDVMNYTWNFVTGCNAGTAFGITWPTDSSCP